MGTSPMESFRSKVSTLLRAEQHTPRVLIGITYIMERIEITSC